jgi:hypothetical protein
MSSCIIGHKWSKYHIVETYTNNLAQARVCKNCGELFAINTSLIMIRQEQLKALWDRYHLEEPSNLIRYESELYKARLQPMNEVETRGTNS